MTSHSGTTALLYDLRNPHRVQALALGALPRHSHRPRQFQVQNGGVHPTPTPRASGKGLRRAELLAAISLAIDLGLGQPMEHMLRSSLIATRIAERMGLDAQQRAIVYYANSGGLGRLSRRLP